MIKLLLCVTSFTLVTSSLTAQVKKEETKVEDPIELPKEIEDGQFYPLFWNAVILKKKEGEVDHEEEHAFIELSKVKTFAKQRYTVNGKLVREFSVVLEDKIFVRFYHIEEQQNLQNRVKGVTDKVLGEGFDVGKTYPDTTHKEMLEFRVARMEHIKLLFNDFRKVFLANKMKAYIEDQREEVVSQLKLKADIEKR